MKNIKNRSTIIARVLLLLAFFCSTLIYAKEQPDPRTGKIPPLPPQRYVAINNVFMQVNNLNTVFRSDGIFNSDFVDYSAETAGLIWPVTAATVETCDFATGCWVGAQVGGYGTNHIRTAAALYASHYSPGNIPSLGQVPASSVCNDPTFRVYQVSVTNPQLKNGGTVVKHVGGKIYNIIYDSWDVWPVNQGAPYVEVNGIPGYQPEQGDRPGIGNSNAQPDAILFTSYMDYTNCTDALHLAQISLPGGTLPLGVEIHQISFAFNSPGLQDMYFSKFVIINRSSNEWDSTYVAITNDIDDGYAFDDGAGCDSAKSLGFIYNNGNNDPIYGAAPPAVGQKYLQSPIIYTGNPADSAKLPYDTLVGYTELGMTGFNVFFNGSDPCKSDPPDYIHGYNFLKGNDGCGNPLYNWVYGHPTHYAYTGSYCNGSQASGWYDSAAQDRRFIQDTGPFVMHSNDTQQIVIGIFMARGNNNINSVCQVINSSQVVQQIYNRNFLAIPLPPPPSVNTVADGNGYVTLYWGDTSEYYSAYDFIDSTGYWKFEGYEVYQVRAGTGGDNASDRQLLAVYDVVDSIDLPGGPYTPLMDSIEVQQPNGQNEYAYQPVTFGTNSGISRAITLNANQFPQTTTTNFVNGQTYYFSVVAYACNVHGPKGFKVLKNSVSSQLLSVTPNYPPPGSNFAFGDFDTLTTNRVDRGFMPIVLDPKKVLTATYTMSWNSDTSYKIIRTMNGSSVTVIPNAVNIYATQGNAYVVDGIQFKADTINRYHYGVINDPGPGRQTSGKGWTYTGGAPNVKGIDTSLISNMPGLSYAPPQSLSMGLTWPNGIAFRSQWTQKIDSTFIKTYGLKHIEIRFSNTNKQYAYKYAGSIVNAPYRNFVQVPFTVWVNDPLDTSGTARQVNVAYYDGNGDSVWNPHSAPDTSRDILFILYTNYSSTPNSYYTSKNINFKSNFSNFDIEYVWWPQLIDKTKPMFAEGDVLTIIPYTKYRLYQSPGFVTTASTSVTAPIIASNSLAQQRGELSNVRVVPNPYYGQNQLETTAFNHIMTFMRLPYTCNIFIYSLNGNLVRKLAKNDNTTAIIWDLNNTNGVPVASGIYIAYIDAPGIGTQVIKLAVFQPHEVLGHF